MNIFKLAPLALAISVVACQSTEVGKDKTTQVAAIKANQTIIKNIQSNPLVAPFSNDQGIPPFEQINDSHYLPALEYAITLQKNEIESIANNTAKPNFVNTIEALEKSGALLDQITSVFFALKGANTNDTLQAVAKEITPKLTQLSDDVYLNPQLFTRIKSVYQDRDKLNLRTDQKRLLETQYKSFVRGGANLNDADKASLRQLNEKISSLSVKFGENLLAETNDYALIIDNETDLSGLPESSIAAAAAEATKRGHPNKWIFTTHRPSKNPFLTYADNRQLRQQIFMAYTHRADNDNVHDNKQIAAEIASLRFSRAQILGYPTHAHYVLEKATAKTPENVYNLLNQVWPAALAQAENEVVAMQQLADSEGADFKIAAWDWWYYSEKIRKAQYDLDEAQTKPYFSLESTLEGVFYTANKLWGVSFKEREDLPKYHPDVRTFEVYDHDKSYIGIYMYDPYVRESKRGGAWMSSFRKQTKMNGKEVTPIIYNVTNFPAPVNGEPVLLSFSQASTLFHEFGHAIQGLLSDGYYLSQTGTALPRDYVEYPSQVMENWMMEPTVLAKFAKHYQTGEVIPQAIIKKIQAAAKFNQGFGTTEYMAAALLDLKWHTLETAEIQDADKFEAEVLSEIGLIDEITPRYRTTYFSHIFAGGYSAGYYGYIWSNIYDADTWTVFKDKGIFDKTTAKGYRKHVLETGGTDDPATMYRRFRGQDPSIEPLLKRRGLTTQ